MKKNEFYKRVKEVMNDLGIREGESTYTVKELTDIARGVGVDMFYVMSYLRYGRV